MSQMNENRAWMLTKMFSSAGLERNCLSFNFTTDGLSYGSFGVHLYHYNYRIDLAREDSLNYKDSRILWSKKDSMRGRWSSLSLTYTSYGYHNIFFVAEKDPMNAGYPGYSAIDDIIITAGPCEFDCYFDKDLCHFKNAEEGSGWELRRGGYKKRTGPSSCHQFSRDLMFSFGGCAIFDSAYPRRPGDTARLVSQMIKGRDDPICLGFWANMYGGGIGSLSVSITVPSTNATKEVWKQEGSFDTEDHWVQCQTPITSLEDFFITFQATIGEQEFGDIGLDTITFTRNDCQRLPQGLDHNSTSDCTFYSSSCAWSLEDEESSSRPFLKLASGKHEHTRYLNTIGRFDSMYAKFDLKSSRIPYLQTMALLYTVPTTGSYCLRFWVFMHTPELTENELGSLRVIVRSKGNETVWGLTNHHHAKWTMAKVPLQVKAGDIIAIEGTKGKTSNKGEMGVDDIALYEGMCEILPVAARVTQQDCTFDQGSCGWRVLNSSQEDNWTWSDGTSFHAMRDKTYNSTRGSYMFLGKKRLYTQLWSQLVSPIVAANKEYCLTWYFAYGHADFSGHHDLETKLTVFLKDLNTDNMTQVWEVDMSNTAQAEFLESNEWTFAQVALPTSSSSSLQEIYIEGRVYNSFWAIDNIRLYPGIKDCRKRPTFI